MLTYEEKKPFSVQHKENQSHVTAVAMSPDGSVIVTGEPSEKSFVVIKLLFKKKNMKNPFPENWPLTKVFSVRMCGC